MADDLERETTELLQRLVRFNTVNPPGNEREAQELAGRHAARRGLRGASCSARTEERPNLVARLRGARATARRCACSRHVDTVLADPAEWQRDPWSGDVVDGVLWGRGAQDMKSQMAAEVAAARRSRARAGARRAASCSSSSVVDEETGGGRARCG